MVRGKIAFDGLSVDTVQRQKDSDGRRQERRWLRARSRQRPRSFTSSCFTKRYIFFGITARRRSLALPSRENDNNDVIRIGPSVLCTRRIRHASLLLCRYIVNTRRTLINHVYPCRCAYYRLYTVALWKVYRIIISVVNRNCTRQYFVPVYVFCSAYTSIITIIITITFIIVTVIIILTLV